MIRNALEYMTIGAVTWRNTWSMYRKYARENTKRMLKKSISPGMYQPTDQPDKERRKKIWGRLVCLGPKDQPYSTASQKSGIWFFLRIDKYNSFEQPVE